MKAMTPRQIVKELDKYIVGQEAAKKSVAIAMRNRWRRLQVPDHLREEIMPNNIILIGSTGVGKTEIARRLAMLADAPFIKVEASKFTEVGYVGRDVESIVRDLTEVAVNMVRHEKEDEVEAKALELADDRLLDILFPLNDKPVAVLDGGGSADDEELRARHQRTREKLRKRLHAGEFEDRLVEIKTSVDAAPNFAITLYQGDQELGANTLDLGDLRGRPVVLNFWAGLCPPCRAEMPDLQEFHDEFKDKVTLIGIDLGRHTGLGSKNDAQRLLNELEITYPAGFTNDASVAMDYEVLAMPTTVFINSKGEIFRKWGGLLTLGVLSDVTNEMLALES